MTTTTDLLSELNRLIRLTAVEAAVARARTTQARDDDVRAELTKNARNADRRRERLAGAVRDLGGLPDRLGAAVATAGTFARTQTVDQAVPLAEGLMADLALEHQLRDRAAFARVLAESLDETAVARFLTDVEAAHEATIDWIGTRLGEVALGGPAALRPTPVQALAGLGRRAVQAPQQLAAAGVNRTVAVAERVADGIGARLGRTRDLAEAAEEALAAGRDAALRAGEEQAEQQGADRTVRALHEVRARSGALDADELPIARYGSLNAVDAASRIRRLTDAGDVRVVLAHEEANKARRRVIDAAHRRLDDLAERAVNG